MTTFIRDSCHVTSPGGMSEAEVRIANFNTFADILTSPSEYLLYDHVQLRASLRQLTLVDELERMVWPSFLPRG